MPFSLIAPALRVVRRAPLLLLVAALLAALLPLTAPGASAAPPAPTDSPHVTTWDHADAVATTAGGLADGQVRESPFYSVQVTPVEDPAAVEQSFTYLSLPRNGEGKRGYDTADGAEFAAESSSTMSWSSFEHDVDVDVDITLETGQRLTNLDDVTIRPTNLELTTTLVDEDTVRVRVPASSAGLRFSVDLAPQMRDVHVSADGALSENPAAGTVLESEPRNAMMIFAQPPAPEGTVPTEADGAITRVQPGEIRDLDTTDAEILYFGPGTYWMGSDYRAMLPESVRWVYLAPGAFVKGAFRFTDSDRPDYKVTGYGVLSGEQYVYEADTANSYQHRDPSTDNCHASCVKMLQFGSADAEQHLRLQGVTIKEPPYHSFVVYGNEDTFHMDVSEYQQVGSWYWQTDGIELYSGSTMRHTFFHANDDVLKLYHSDVSIEDTVIWKGENGPVIQWGWSPRTIDGVDVTDTTVIHNRMLFGDTNTCVVNASPHWDPGQHADRGTTVRNMTFTNTVVEGKVNCGLRIWTLSNTENIEFHGLHIDAWSDQSLERQRSVLSTLPEASGTPVSIGDETTDRNGLLLRDYTVGGEAIDKDGDNWASNEPGRLNFDANLWDSWDAEVTGAPQAAGPRLQVDLPADGATLDSRSLTIAGTTTAARVVVTVDGTEQAVPLHRGRFSLTTEICAVTSSVRVAAYKRNGAATVERRTLHAFGETVGSITDPAGDDDPGSYTYPTDGAFTPGTLDLTGMSVHRDQGTIRFVTTVGRPITNPWGGDGMSIQRLHLTLRDPARTDTAPAPLLPGTNMQAAGAWDRVLVADGRGAGTTLGPGVYNDAGERLGDVDLQVQGDRIILSVPEDLLGGVDPASALYQVAMHSSAESGEAVGHVRPVVSAACARGEECESWVGRYRIGGGLGVPLGTAPFDTDLQDANAIDVISGEAPQSHVLAVGADREPAPYLPLTTDGAAR